MWGKLAVDISVNKLTVPSVAFEMLKKAALPYPGEELATEGRRASAPEEHGTIYVSDVRKGNEPSSEAPSDQV